MFLNRWTIQIAKEGQNEELSFNSKDEALTYANRLFAGKNAEVPASLILVDPNNAANANYGTCSAVVNRTAPGHGYTLHSSRR